MKNLQTLSPANESDVCSIPAPSCTIDPTFEKHTGEYWCENDEGQRSQALNISITDGPVILKFTARPVKEGSDVILHCINKKDEKPQTCDFIKDGESIKTTYDKSNVLTLHNVSTSHEGFYKCSISGVGDSAESWLAVVKPGNEFDDEEAQPVRYLTPVTILLCIFGSLLLLAGLIFFKKHKALKHEAATDLNSVTYAVVNKPRRRNGGETRTDHQVTYASVALRPTGTFYCNCVFNHLW
ncbi:uncharacterized protein LOC103130544 [Poecilia formosa]|uniref:uncharacterized protein LOC103130544 n=1 Tax=Poecilia formosa TaxID=48698 RepID=UPI0007B7E69A|nr:PREDICTED: uncharacterized protein LOC103130544 [Poecilia formosa]